MTASQAASADLHYPDGRARIATRLGSWSATSRQAEVLDAARTLYAAIRPLAEASDTPPSGGLLLDRDLTPSLRVRVIEDGVAENGGWMHIEGPYFRFAARAPLALKGRPSVRTSPLTAEHSGQDDLVVVSFVGDDRSAVACIREALLTLD